MALSTDESDRPIQINEPVAISKIRNRYFLFDVNVVTYLRQKHNICGVLIGTIPQAPQQNIFQGLPLELLTEEVIILVEKEAAYIIEDTTLHKAWLTQDQSKSLHIDFLRTEKQKVDVKSAFSITPTVTMIQSSPQRLQQEIEQVPKSYPLFAHLHAQDYFITPGLRFGCDYTVYPGDPLRFHSHFLANGYAWDEEVPLLDLVGGGRLGTGVKKGFLIGGKQESSSSVRAFSIEWAGM